MDIEASPIVDAHVHVASSDTSLYPRNPTGLGSAWWEQPSDADALGRSLSDAGVARAVVVQAVGVYGFDCRYAADVSEAGAHRFAFVGAIDLAGPDIEGAARELCERHGATGLRLFGVGAAGAAWLTDGTGASVWKLASELGCTLIPTIFSDGLASLRTLMEDCPDVPVALDHCAFPDLGGPEAIEQLCALAELPRLHLKVTSHNLHHVGDPAAFLQPLVEAFGPERLCWGSDHPQHVGLSYPAMVDLARHASRHLSPGDRDLFLGGNALRLWW